MNPLHLYRRLRRKKQLESDMAAEMEHHLELLTERHRAVGLSPQEARFAALREFGNVASVQERAREVRTWTWFEQLGQDLRYAVRTLAKARGFTAVAALTLALGIGSTTAIFSVIYGVLLDPYPYAKSAEIWAPELRDPKTGRGAGLRMTDYLEMCRLPATASAMATAYTTATLSGGINPELIQAPRVTGSAFEFLGVPPLLGRGLTPADIQPDGKPQPVTVISFRLWQRLFNGDPTVLGRTLVLNDEPHVIVGVMPPRFGWYTNSGLWLPLPTTDLQMGVRTIVRFKPGVTKEVASAQLLDLLKAQARLAPGRFPGEGFNAWFNNYLHVTVASGQMQQSLLLLLGAVGFLLLIACTNVANLQLARGAGRSQEIAVRLALGASRARVGRQLLTESVLLAVTGGLIGVGIAHALVHVAVQLMPVNFVPNEARIALNGWVLLGSSLLAVLTGIVSGLFPAWQCTRPDLNKALKEGSQGADRYAGNRTRSALVVVQVALSLVLLVGASLMTMSFVRAVGIGESFHADRLLLLRVPLAEKRYTTYEQRLVFARDFTDRMRALPGVTLAGIGVPPGVESRSGVEIPGQPKPAEGLYLNFIGAEYPGLYGLALKSGRLFTAQDIERRERVALISESAAKLWADGESPLGRTINVDGLVGGGAANLPAPGAVKQVTIVGVIADFPTFGPLKPPPQTIFVPHTLRAAASRAFVLRTAVEPATLLNTVRGELRAMDQEQPMLNPVTFEELIEEDAAAPRFNMALFAVLAGMALALAAAGIYSVLAFAVAQRSREIGIRMALGAQRGDVQRLFLGRGAVLIGLGMLAGLALSVGLGRLVYHQISDVGSLDPISVLLATALLGGLAFLACLLPARRATKVDPLIALRSE